MTIEIKDLRRVVVGPNDRFVVKIDECMSPQAITRMEHYFVGALGAPVVILQRGQSLDVVGPAD